jgi:arylsulfatase
MNSWIKATPKEQPVFAWLAFTAPHDPLQAPDEWISRFKGQYEQGYAEVYRQRIARLKALGLSMTTRRCRIWSWIKSGRR